eukprot:3219511-Pleurochrysis_carterae.AAC.1
MTEILRIKSRDLKRVEYQTGVDWAGRYALRKARLKEGTKSFGSKKQGKCEEELLATRRFKE